MFNETIDQLKNEAAQLKMYWDTDPDFRKGVALYALKGIAIGVVTAAPYLLGHKVGYVKGYSNGYAKGYDTMGSWTCDCLNAYDVKMPDALRMDILAGKRLPFSRPTK